MKTRRSLFKQNMAMTMQLQTYQRLTLKFKFQIIRYMGDTMAIGRRRPTIKNQNITQEKAMSWRPNPIVAEY